LSAAGVGADDPLAGAPNETFESPLLMSSSTFLLPMALSTASTCA